jgi:hypothetical protein
MLIILFVWLLDSITKLWETKKIKQYEKSIIEFVIKKHYKDCGILSMVVYWFHS